MRKNISIYLDNELTCLYSYNASKMSAVQAGDVIKFAWLVNGGLIDKVKDKLAEYDIRPVYSEYVLGVSSMTANYTSYLKSKTKAFNVVIEESGATIPVLIGMGDLCKDIEPDVFCWVAGDDDIKRLSKAGNGAGFYIV